MGQHFSHPFIHGLLRLDQRVRLQDAELFHRARKEVCVNVQFRNSIMHGTAQVLIACTGASVQNKRQKVPAVA